MTIKRIEFDRPVVIPDLIKPDIGYLLLFGREIEVPADHKVDITPPGARIDYILHTKAVENLDGVEDTIGMVEVRLRPTRSSYRSGEVDIPVMVVPISPSRFVPVTALTPVFLITDGPNANNSTDWTSNIPVSGVVRWVRPDIR